MRSPTWRGSAPLLMAALVAICALVCGCRDSAQVARPTASSPGTAAAVVDGSVLDATLRAAGEHWYGAYMLGRKIGHGRVAWRATQSGEPGAVVAVTDVSMLVQGPTAANEMRYREERFYGARAPFYLVASRFQMDASGARDEREVLRQADGRLRLTRSVNGQPQPATILPATAETLTSWLAALPLSVAHLKVGDPASEVEVFDWTSQADTRVVVKVLEVGEQQRAGIKLQVARLAVSYEALGLQATYAVTDGGVALEMVLGAGVMLKLEDRGVATSDVVGLDVLGAGIKVDAKLAPAHEVTALELSVGVPAGFQLPSSPRQVVTPRGDKLRVALRRGPGATVTPEERAEALAADSIIDKDVPEVVAQARAIVNVQGKGEVNAADRADATERLVRWVYGAVDKRLATHLPTASVVLDKRIGDCTEHTWLFTALARAAGIPARPVYGVAFSGGSFAYHAWAEVELDGRWVAVDPTWGELRADATHLALGHKVAVVASAIGGLSIEVVGEAQRGSTQKAGSDPR